MPEMVHRSCDVAVIGGGPAGISACLELAKVRKLKVHLFENESELGGIPRSAHIFFGMRDLKRLYTGAAYARRLEALVRKTATAIHTRSTVVEIKPDKVGKAHRVFVASSEGMVCYTCRFVVLATGCFEGSRESRMIAGTRPAGIMTTGTLQKLVNLQGLQPGRRAVIIGSEHVALSAAMTLRHAGLKVQALVEEDLDLHTYPSVANMFAHGLRFPIFKNAAIKSICGKNRVTGIVLANRSNGHECHVACDTIIVTGRFQPESALIMETGIQVDPLSRGPVVDLGLMTSLPGIYAAGNILRGANMHDVCALEGRQVAASIITSLTAKNRAADDLFTIIPEGPVRFVVPQNYSSGQLVRFQSSWFKPGVTFQVDRSLHRPTIVAICNGARIWQKTYPRLLANNAIVLPVEKFKWRQCPFDKPVRLICTSAS
jgi:thioredoxin reductase